MLIPSTGTPFRLSRGHGRLPVGRAAEAHGRCQPVSWDLLSLLTLGSWVGLEGASDTNERGPVEAESGALCDSRAPTESPSRRPGSLLWGGNMASPILSSCLGQAAVGRAHTLVRVQPPAPWTAPGSGPGPARPRPAGSPSPSAAPAPEPAWEPATRHGAPHQPRCAEAGPPPRLEARKPNTAEEVEARRRKRRTKGPSSRSEEALAHGADVHSDSVKHQGFSLNTKLAT